LALKGKDVAGQSQTGTGKTAAFLITGFTRLLRSAEAPAGAGTAPRMLIIAPTRELVVQIEADARLLGALTPLRILAVYGGIDYAKQRDALAAGCDVLVGTPGRLIDYLKQHVWSPRRVEVLVIDEADRMFDMGFISDLRFLLRRLPPPERRQSFLFSATLSFRVLELTWEFMNNPAQITIMPEQKTVEQVVQTLYHVGREDKFRLLLGLLRQEGGERILIFSNTREEARRLEDRLTRNGWEARALTGDVEQKRRLRILNDFKEGKLPVLVASDVASRGLHIEAVSHVVNWDLPQDPEDYVHRIGRTARAGAEGKAISLVDEASALNLESIEKFLGRKIPVAWPEDDFFMEEIKPTTEERRRFAEERRTRLDARARRDGRERGSGRTGERPARREPPHRPEISSDQRRATAPADVEPRESRGSHDERAAPPAPARPEPRVRFETVTVGDPLGPVAAPPATPAPDGATPGSRRRPRRPRRPRESSSGAPSDSQ
jgi:ATP-dependent RNA helicase RhlB